MAHHQLAHRHERKARGSFYCCPRAGRRRTTAADQGQGSATSARRRGLAHRRTQDVAREVMKTRQWDLAIRDLSTAISLQVGGSVLLMNVDQFRAIYPRRLWL